MTALRKAMLPFPKPTELDDTPGSRNPNGFNNRFKKNIKKIVYSFETCAICADTGEILGCVTWKTELSQGEGGKISVDNNEGKPSNTFKKAFKKFIKTHTKKKKGVLHWFCPETGKKKPSGKKVKGPKGTTSDPFGGAVPSGLKSNWVDAVKKGEQTKLDENKANTTNKKPLRQIINDNWDDIERAGLKFTWAGEQIKTVASVCTHLLSRH